MIEKAIVETLTMDETVYGLVANRIRPMLGAQGNVQPRIVYVVTADDPVGTFQSSSSWNTATIQFDCIADTQLDCINLGKEIKRVLNWVRVITSEVRISPSRLTEETDVEQAIIEGTGQTVYFRTQTYEMQYRALDEYGA